MEIKHRLTLLLCMAFTAASAWCWADGPKDNLPDQVRAVPPVGIELSEEDRTALTEGLRKLNADIVRLKSRRDARTPLLLPDVEIFARAIRDGLAHREFFSPRDVANGKNVLAEGQKRAASLLKGEAPWTMQKGLVVRGYRSRIDRTVQPYGLVIPESYSGEGKSKYRLDLWFHGRGERSTESVFIAQRMTSPGRFRPRDTIVLHPYGRYSNAFKFAGEVDVLEALEHAQQNYKIDDDRIAVRGFSMGGAGCWQMAVHYPTLFFAANPGAGFSETPEFLKFFQKETLDPTWYEKKLWRMYDCPGYAANLFQLPTVAYSGELDIQKQAADIMEQAVADEGMRLTHVIGAKTKHTIDAPSLRIVEEKLDHLAQRGRVRLPRELRFATYTLKYNRLHWLTVTGLGEHWRQARVNAKIQALKNTILLDTENVTSLRLDIPAGRSPFALDKPVKIVLGDSSRTITAGLTETDRSWQCQLYWDGSRWQQGAAPAAGLSKQHNLQGPIDDAFMDSFVVVRPSGPASHEAIQNWSESELDHFVREWRRQFRGDAVVKLDSEITKQDVAKSHLILFGDPASNSTLREILDQLPIQWTKEKLIVGKQQFDAAHHAPAMIYPNPKNPQRYVVINSGFTYREYAYLNNARQVPKLPDWAVVDLRKAPDTLWPGRIVAADFFDEQWQVK